MADRTTTDLASIIPQIQQALTSTTAIQSQVTITVQSSSVTDLQPKTPNTLTEFTCFSKLPNELKDIVWKLSIRPRLVEIWNHCVGVNERKWRGQSDDLDVVPFISKVCHSSRRVFLQEYRLFIPRTATRSPVYVNTIIDTVLVHSPFFHGGNAEYFEGFRQFLDMRIETEPQIRREGSWKKRWEIRNLAFPGSVLFDLFTKSQTSTSDGLHALSILQNFPELDNLVFVNGIGSRGRDTRLAVVIPESDLELKSWEVMMSLLGQIQSPERGKALDYPKWPDLKVSCAVFRREYVRAAITDRRDGLVLFGPTDCRPIDLNYLSR